MEPAVWWLLLVVLSVILVLALIVIGFVVFKDLCNPKSNLIKYKYEITDLEDLTRFQNDFRKLPRFSCVNEVDSGVGAFRKLKQKEEEKSGSVLKTLSNSVDDLEFCDPSAIDVLKQISDIEDRAKNIEEDINSFAGNISDVGFYEVNEKLLMCLIDLSEVQCSSIELRSKKMGVMEFVEACQQKLKNNVK